jgi:mannose-1-phosphate guanylyltransferase/mannose-1-phosphate guanylyltransferase/mannose-6-phosphate isomerase
MAAPRLIPVILSGGSGTRLWPMSRPQEPKQLLAMLDERTMLQSTIDRLEGIAGVASPIIVCAASHRDLVASQAPDGAMLILEPMGRNTAPAVAAAAFHAESTGGGVLIVLPADHVIRSVTALHEAIERAVPVAADGRLVTFGIVPTYPETGYGYIHAGPETQPGVRRVAAFVEKPPLDVAERYIADGDHLWNSGMFVFRSDRYLAELERHAPSMVDATRAAIDAGSKSPGVQRLDHDRFSSCPADSIDFAVMEKTDNAMVVPLDAGWDDVGSWSALWNLAARDEAGNAISGDVLAIDVTNSYVRSEARLVTAVGVDDLVIVETADAVLVVPKTDAQRVKEVVATLVDRGRRESTEHLGHVSAWGRSATLERDTTHEVRRLEIAPGEEIALESTADRAEMWIVVSGTANTSHRGSVATGAMVTPPPSGQWTAANHGDDPLVVIIVSIGGDGHVDRSRRT